MIALTAIYKEKLLAAEARAKKENLAIVEGSGEITAEGACLYVNSSSRPNDLYCVIIAKDNGKILAQCTCEGAERGLICKHVGLVAYAFKAWLLARRAEAEALEAPAKTVLVKKLVPSDNRSGYEEMLVELPIEVAILQGYLTPAGLPASRFCGCGAEIALERALCAECQLEKDRADIFGA